MPKGVYIRKHTVTKLTREKMKRAKIGKHYKMSDNGKENIRQAQIIRWKDQEQRKKQSLVFLGKKQTLEHRENSSKSQLKRYEDLKEREKTGLTSIGRKSSLETKEKQRQAKLGKKASLITLEKQSKAQLKRFQDHIESEKQSRIKSLDEIKKIRRSRIRHIENNFGIAIPSYNLNSCEYFKSFDIENNTQGRYAVYGNGEHYIEELGYFPDYINFDLKLIIEWDEEHHFDENGNLCERDIQRQQEIQELYPDFEFRRIREKEIISKLSYTQEKKT